MSGMTQDEIDQELNTDGFIVGYKMGKRLTIGELKQKKSGDIVWLRFRGGADPRWRIDNASKILDIMDSNGEYSLGFVDYDFYLDNKLKDSDENLDSHYGEAYICEAIKK